MPAMSMVQALNSGMEVMLARDPDVVIFGEDVGFYGGVFRVTDGLQKKFGDQRVFDTPIAEGGMLATAVGMGAYGLRPIVEIQFADYIYPATDQLISAAARLRYRSAGEFWAPITVRAPCGGGIFGGQTHSQSVEAIFTHVCGLKTVIPSNPYDAKGLLISAIEDDDPVVFFEPKRLYNGPLDLETIVDSVKKTGRCVIAHEATRTCGFGAELAALVQEHCFYHLEAPIVRVTGWDTPYPHALEWAYFPGPSRVADGLRRALEG